VAFLNQINEWITIVFIVPILLLLGGYFSLRLKFPQFSRFFEGLRDLIKTEKKSKGNVSNFEAISAVLAGNFGTGNIAGTAVALSIGGPGAIFWMWIMTIFGTVIKYASCFLGVRYRTKNAWNEYVGGPMFYLSRGCNRKWLAILFCIFSITTAFTVGNIVQINSVILPIKQIGLPPSVVVVGIAICVALVLLRGMQGFAKVAKTIVPLMATIYFSSACFVLFSHIERIPEAFRLIFWGAFHPQAASGGLLGFGIMKAMIVGFERGIFATDAGLGIASVLQSEARTKSSVEEGIVAMVAPWFVMIICTITALVLLTTGAWTQPELKSTNMCIWAFQQTIGEQWAHYIITVTLLLFAYTTILAWACCAERSVEYLGKKHWIRPFYYTFIATLPLGAFFQVEFVWTIADLSVAFMLLTNMIGIIILSPQVVRESQAAFASESSQT